MSIIVAGIDPQPSLLAICIIRDEVPFYWEVGRMKRRSCFKSAQDWQEYIVVSCFATISFLKRQAPNIIICIEQQRGRVNSLIEQSLLHSAFTEKVKCMIFHPGTWKKLVGLERQGTGNLKNKEASMARVMPLLQQFKNGNIPHRSHDLCDAYLIALAGHKFLMKKDRQEIPPILLEDESDESISTISTRG